MIKTIAFAVFIFFLGVEIGTRIRTNRINRHISKLIQLEQMIKRENNQMVDHFATLYSMTDHDDKAFTEVDAMLSSMWMD